MTPAPAQLGILCEPGQLDQQLSAEAGRIDSNGVYTRYADDICFSCFIKGSCNEFLDRLVELTAKTTNPHLEVNSSKTKFASRKGRRVITGLYLSPSGKVSIGRDKKKYIKSLIHSADIGKITDAKQLIRIRGYLAYVADVEPDYYNAMVVKYGSSVFDRIKSAKLT